ncbi:MAG: polysaccharide deacetylase family protein [Defluviitaleaceae bacterium]|nr:polysaccharide deacetylase family protein [Defluviitaleaceae bacterium]MCL2239647.1 polysaccharide deacetylase family protein [Defluviitaleaceae bacterium]
MVVVLGTHAYAGEGWGLNFGEKGAQPRGNKSAEYLLQFDAYYVGAEEDKVIYLTFDAGYENDLTAGILDTLKKHNAPAAFFLVGTYIRDQPELIRRMVSEGHIVANHSMSHPDMTQIGGKEAFHKELKLVEDVYRNITGQEIPRFYRPPKGIYNEANLKHAKELGYTTVFWSLAYRDWENDNQPTKEEAFAKLLPRIHPGAVILLHNTSKTNAVILDELLTKYKELGYRFEGLAHLTH